MEKALYILAGYDELTEIRLQGVQNALYARGFEGTHTKNIPLHITLAFYPSNPLREAELKEMLQKLVKEVSPFDVTFNHIGIFDGGRVLFIAPDCNEKLLKIKELFGSSFNWTPHTTMLMDEQSSILKALPIALQEFSAFKGKVTALHLYEFWPTRHILTVYLEK